MTTPPRQFKDSIFEQFARLGKAIMAPKRLELLDLLCQGPRTVEALAEQAGISVANASQYLQVLRAARLVENEKKGLYVEYRVADDEVCTFFFALRGLTVAGETLEADYLIVALGAELAPDTVPGLQDAGHKVPRHAPHRLLEHLTHVARAQLSQLLEGEIGALLVVGAIEEDDVQMWIAPRRDRQRANPLVRLALTRRQSQADYRVNGIPYPAGTATLRDYVASWTGAGFAFRKQYVIVHTMTS